MIAPLSKPALSHDPLKAMSINHQTHRQPLTNFAVVIVITVLPAWKTPFLTADWLQGWMVSREVLNRVDHKTKVEPATLKRQKEIFGMIARREWPIIETIIAPEVTP